MKLEIFNWAATSFINKFYKFSLVGGSALCIDFILLVVMIDFMYMDPYLSKIISMIIMIFYTWYFNRTFTFKNRKRNRVRQIIQYYLFMFLGLSVNYSIYFLSLSYLENINYNYLVSSALGSATAMMINFCNMNFIIFKKKL